MANYERGSADDVRVFDGAEDEEDAEGSRLPLLIVIALLVLAAFGAVVYLAYQRGVSQGHNEIRTLAAAPGPAKLAPANAGGTPTPYTGLKIYQQPAPTDDRGDSALTPAPAAATPLKPAPVAATPAAMTPKPAAVTAAPSKPVETAPASAMVTAAPLTKPVAIAPKPAAIVPKPAVVTPKLVPTQTAAMTPKPAPVQIAAAPPPLVTPPPAAVAPAATAPAGSGFVQIGSYKSMAEANAAWRAYKVKYASAIGGLSNDVRSVNLGAKGTWYRSRIVTPSRDDAATLCTKLKAAGGDCILAK